jgi:hypothetical protein
MFPIDIPAGTTIDTLLTKVLPDTHARFVPDSAPKDELSLALRLEGGASYAISVKGKDLTVRESDGDFASPVALWVSVAKSSVQIVLDDWLGPKRFMPKNAPPGGLVLMTDPRILKRLMMVSGRLELAVTDVGGERVSLTVGAGEAAKRGIDTESPDAVIEAKMDVVEKVLAFQIPPEDVLADGHVAMRGKSFLAMQFALAIAPFFPAHKR